MKCMKGVASEFFVVFATVLGSWMSAAEILVPIVSSRSSASAMASAPTGRLVRIARGETGRRWRAFSARNDCAVACIERSGGR